MPKRSPLLEIRHTDRILVRVIASGFAETSVTTWEKLKAELFNAGKDEDDVRAIAKLIASGLTAKDGGGSAPRYEYTKAPPL